MPNSIEIDKKNTLSFVSFIINYKPTQYNKIYIHIYSFVKKKMVHINLPEKNIKLNSNIIFSTIQNI